ncbi:MAG: glycoside hydrolase family 2 [Muribaculaceae bacterium]|nr:glycoside hydrolase family 2 [Muribaculaceae bacterium]
MKHRISAIIITLFAGVLAVFAGNTPPQTVRHYLSGIDKGSDVKWDFMCSSGHNSGKWTQIKVPSCWETQGFGTYYYGWEEPKESDETGYYRHKFFADKAWKGNNISLVFEGSMTDTEVKLNGKKVGDTHEGGFYRFSYDLSDRLNYGKENLLEVKVRKCPADSSIYRAERQTDFWLFGGIYRPVYLEIKPLQHIESLAVDARADGSLAVCPVVSRKNPGNVRVRVETLDGKQVLATVSGNAGDTLRTKVNGVKPWNQEHPVLYRVVAELVGKNGVVKHQVDEKIGFRTVEFRPADGFYLNGRRIIFKGVNRHCFHPESGRTLSRDISLADAELIKDMNMNAVRMSHYPPDKDFLEICDSIGLLVIDELCGWQKKYDTGVARRLAKSVVERDRNHPSIVLWANGNEGGWNTDVDDDYKLYDLQQRFVMHPWERFRGTDTKHYPDYNYVVNSAVYDNDVFYPTEFMHGVFDGGAAASLRDFWDVMMKHRAPAGGFIWALLDEGLVRSDMNDSIDCRYDLAPDGIVGPNREKEGSFYAVKDIWSPVRIVNRVLTESPELELRIENDYMFTNLSECGFSYALYDISNNNKGGFEQTVVSEGNLPSPEILPGERREVRYTLPDGWYNHDLIAISVTDPHGRHIYTYNCPLGNDRLQKRLKNVGTPGAVEMRENDTLVTIVQGGKSYNFSKVTGRLEGIETPKGHISLQGFPSIATSGNKFKELVCYRDGDTYVVEPRFDDRQWIKWIFSPSDAPRIDYNFSVDGEVDYIGVGFDYPEEKILAMEWIGNGPYRVWKNRLDGVTFGRHFKKYNNTVTGESWNYPEFKGYHSDCRAVTVKTSEGDFTLVPSRSGLFFQMLTPQSPKFAGNGHIVPPFPKSSLGFMSAIPAIGTKFQSPAQLGPSGQKNMQLNYVPFSGSIYLIL